MFAISMITKRFSLLSHALFYIFILMGCAEGKFDINHAWVAEAPPNVIAQAGYLTLNNSTDKPMSLVDVTSNAFETIQIHRSEHDAATGLVKMIHEKQADIPANSTLQFKPGGHHLMLMKPTLSLKEGDQVVMNLIFADGAKFKITFAVRREKFTL